MNIVACIKQVPETTEVRVDRNNASFERGEEHRQR
jgi:electron transfer flavoprotein alpha/beta subunit